MLVTAELPPDVQGWADQLRQQHYPPERNRLRAHVTLFHALPPSVEAEVVQVLAGLAAKPSPHAEICGVMKLENGTAFAVNSPEMVDLHADIAERMHGLLSRQDAQPLRLHITIQNKVETRLARALQGELAANFRPRLFRFQGFGLYAWEEGLWRPLRTIVFRR